MEWSKYDKVLKYNEIEKILEDIIIDDKYVISIEEWNKNFENNGLAVVNVDIGSNKGLFLSITISPKINDLNIMPLPLGDEGKILTEKYLDKIENSLTELVKTKEELDE